MGVIIKESFYQTAIRIGISFLSALAVIFLYPKNTELYGLINYVLNTGALLMPFILLGLSQSSLRFFPYSGNNKASRQNFARFLTLIFVVSIGVFFIFFYFFKKSLLAFEQNPSPDLEYYLKYVAIGAILFSAIEILVRYISNYKIVAIPVAFQNAYKIIIPVAFGLIYWDVVSKEAGIQLILFVLFLSVLGLLIMSIRQIRKGIEADVNAGAVEKKSYSLKEFYVYYFWAFASTAGSLVALRIDGLMLTALTNFTINGDYYIAMFITTVVTIPGTAVLNIAHPIVSEAWKDNNIKEIKSVYIKGAENLFFIGVAMLLGVFLLLDFLPMFLDDWKVLGFVKTIVLILGVSRLFDMASGVNGVIIQHSVWYKYNTVFVLFLVVFNVILNYLLITSMESPLIGAALATAISLSLFNIMKTYLIYHKISIHPFKKSMIWFFLGFVVLATSCFLLSNYVGPILSFGINVILVIIFLTTSLFAFGFAKETKESLLTIWRKVKARV